MRTWALVLCAIGSVIGWSAAPSPAQAAGDTLTVGFATEATTLDPTKAAAGADYYFISQMFEQLMRRDPSGKLIHWLAESHSVDKNNGKPVIDVHLRKGVKVHNGDPLTSADFEFAFSPQARSQDQPHCAVGGRSRAVRGGRRLSQPPAFQGRRRLL